jgi:2-haloacid dehalogenase
MNEKWLTFACYGTLIDWQTGFRDLLAPLAGDRVEELINAYHDAESAIEREHSSRSYKDVLRLTLERAAKSIWLTLSDEQSHILIDAWDQLPLFPDTQSALESLRADGWKLGVLTNCDDDLFARTHSRFPLPFDAIVTAQQARSYKPGPALFELFRQQTGTDKSGWLHAAASWRHDMQPAHRLGLTTIWVDREHSGHDPSIVTARIDDLASLPATVRALR